MERRPSPKEASSSGIRDCASPVTAGAVSSWAKAGADRAAKTIRKETRRRNFLICPPKLQETDLSARKRPELINIKWRRWSGIEVPFPKRCFRHPCRQKQRSHRSYRCQTL